MMLTPLEQRLTQENESLREHIQRIEQENKLLREKIDLLTRKLFGSTSEQLDEAQLLLDLQGSEAKKPEASAGEPTALEAELDQGAKALKPKPAQRERKLRIPDNLPVSEAPSPLGRGRDRRSAA
jgi:transposase